MDWMRSVLGNVGALAVVLALGASAPSLAQPVCGDGVIESPEECDDGPANGTPESCCSATCTCEVGMSCGEVCALTLTCQLDGAACECTLPSCGDDMVNQPGEQCDGSDDASCPGRCGLPGTAAPCQCRAVASCNTLLQPPSSCGVATDCPPSYDCSNGACEAGICVVKADCPESGECVHAGGAADGTCTCRGCAPWECTLGCRIGGFWINGCLCETLDDCPPEDDVCFLGVCS